MSPSQPTRQPSNPSLRANSFLSPNTYDDDASSIHSDRDRSDQDTDSEDDEVLLGARTSADIRAHDRNFLLEEEERDKLLLNAKKRRGSGLEEFVGRIFKGKGDKTIASGGDSEKRIPDVDQEIGKAGKTERRKQRRQRRRNRKEKLMEDAEHGEDGELMHSLEDGELKEGSSTGESSESEEHDRRGLRKSQDEISSRRKRWRNWCFIHLIIAVGFAILVLVAYKLSIQRKLHGVKAGQKILSNGTALFAPTTILISLDGFRADFLNRGITPRLNRLIDEGVSPLYMNPSFPSVTFPNHYTLATGLYPEAHGIVGNTFWDVDLQEEFYYTHPDAMQPKWWGGEPIWVTAESQGIRTAIHMWPGSEAHIGGIEPAFLDKFNAKEALPNKVDRILGLLDRKGAEDVSAQVADMRPQFIAAYVPNVDADGHRYGPNSTEIQATIRSVDDMLDHLFAGMEQRNLTDIVNVVVVSDHGMASTDITRLIQLEDLVDTSLVAHTDGWPLYGLRPKNPSDLSILHASAMKARKSNPNFEVYLRDVDMPERYHFSKNERIAPLWIVPKTGWAIVKKSEVDVAAAVEEGKVYRPRGLHGYDHEHPLMRAIFVARGPAFPHKPGSKVEPFQNTEVYNIICDTLSLTPRPNNGTLRLPLKPVGLHAPDHSTPGTGELDFPSTTSTISSTSTVTPHEDANNIISISPIEATPASDPNVVGVDEPRPSSPINIDEPKESGDNGKGKVEITEPGKGDSRPTVNDDETSKSESGKGGFSKWLKEQVEKMKGWIHGLVDGDKKDEKEDEKGE